MTALCRKLQPSPSLSAATAVQALLAITDSLPHAQLTETLTGPGRAVTLAGRLQQPQTGPTPRQGPYSGGGVDRGPMSSAQNTTRAEEGDQLMPLDPKLR